MDFEALAEYLKQAATWIGYVSAIVTAVAIFVKPCRDKIFGRQNINDGIKCMLRSEILRTYYKYHERDTIRQYEMENIHAIYKAYKALGGNSFIDNIYSEMQRWEVET